MGENPIVADLPMVILLFLNRVLDKALQLPLFIPEFFTAFTVAATTRKHFIMRGAL